MDDTDRPLPFASVTRVYSEVLARTFDRMVPGSTSAVTDATGFFQIAGISDEPLAFLAASHAGFAPKFAPNPGLEQDSPIVFKLERAGDIHGVISENGRPIEGIRTFDYVRLRNPDQAYCASATTDADRGELGDQAIEEALAADLDEGLGLVVGQGAETLADPGREDARAHAAALTLDRSRRPPSRSGSVEAPRASAARHACEGAGIASHPR